MDVLRMQMLLFLNLISFLRYSLYKVATPQDPLIPISLSWAASETFDRFYWGAYIGKIIRHLIASNTPIIPLENLAYFNFNFNNSKQNSIVRNLSQRSWLVGWFILSCSSQESCSFCQYNIKSFIMKPLWMCILIAYVACQELIKFSISSYILPDKKLEMELDVTSPRISNQYPVILYMTGLSGLTPSFTQSVLIDSIAQVGNVFITVTKLSTPSPDHAATILGHVIDWINQNMQQVLNNKAPGVIADLDNRLILIGHSGAGQIITEFLNSTCSNVKMQILLDPVDGADVMGTKKSYVITPGKMLPYATPVLVIASQLDGAKKQILPACAPNNVSNLRFYDAMSGPKWFLNISKYGHVDFFNNQYRDVFGVNCASCHKDCTYNDYRTTVKQAILSFIDAIFYQSEIALNVIQSAKFKIPTTFKHNYMGYDIKQKGFCERKQTGLQE